MKTPLLLSILRSYNFAVFHLRFGDGWVVFILADWLAYRQPLKTVSIVFDFPFVLEPSLSISVSVECCSPFQLCLRLYVCRANVSKSSTEGFRIEKWVSRGQEVVSFFFSRVKLCGQPLLNLSVPDTVKILSIWSISRAQPIDYIALQLNVAQWNVKTCF